MLFQESEFLKDMQESATIAMSQKSRELKDEGKDVVSLSLGEPDFNTPDFVKDAAKKAMDNNITKYPPIAGIPELKQAICNKLKRENKLNYSPKEIIVSTGAKQSIMNAVMSLVNKGDEVMLFSPYWVSYNDQVKLMGGKPVEVIAGIEQDYKVTPQQVKAAITDKTKLVIFSSPCNPTGSVYSQSELQAIADVILEYPNIWVISDEIYEYLNFETEHASITLCKGMQERTLIVNGVSKGFAMTGWRLGFLAGPEAIIKSCTKIQGQITSGACSISQMAAIEAFNQGRESIQFMVEAYKIRRDLVIKELSGIDGLVLNKPTGAFYLFPDVSALLGKKTQSGKTMHTATDLSLYLLEEHLVATVAGEAFGKSGCIRLSYAASEEDLLKATKRIKEGILTLA